jgi:hypothetical protein
MFKCPNKY